MSQFSDQQIADFDHLVRARNSIRGFLPDRVPAEVLEQIFETARWSPSGTNVQPWHVCVASGATRDHLREGLMQRFDDRVEVKTDHAPDGKLGDTWMERKRACARAMYGAMDIEWSDRPARGRAARRNYELFDAPHVAFLCMDEVFGTQTAADIGMYTQTLMLAMTTHGVSSCPQGTLRDHPDFVREVFGLEPQTKILFGLTFGYEDPDAGVNQARTERAPISETVQFLD